MRLLLALSFFFCGGLLHGQTYSRVIVDSEIINFINADIARDSIKATKTIRRKIQPLNLDEFYYSDSSDFLKKENNPQFIFARHVYAYQKLTFHPDTLFSRADIDFFRVQIEGLVDRDSWKKRFSNSTLVDQTEMDDEGRVDEVMYTYSLPLFSTDRKRAVIVKGFFCGLLCGGVADYIYERTKGNSWRLIGKLNEWGE